MSLWSGLKRGISKAVSVGGKAIDQVASVGPLVLDLFHIKRRTVAGRVVTEAEKAKHIKDALEDRPKAP